jgi:hypothetical protein
MNLYTLALASEAIAFQNTIIFEQLKTEYTKLQEKTAYIKQKTLYTKEEDYWGLSNLVNIIKKTGLNYTTVLGGDWATYIPMVKANNVLFQKRLQTLADVYGVDAYKDARSVLTSKNVNVAEGYVSLKDAKVSGFFSDIELTLIINPVDILSKRFTPGELAAITLHEIGHCFTAFENLNKFFATNQALASCIAAFKSPLAPDNKTIVYAANADKLKLDSLGKARLMQAKNEKDIFFVLMNEKFNILDGNYNTGQNPQAYNSVSSEYVADEFAARMGAGAELASALVKIKKDQGSTEKKIMGFSVFLSLISAFAFITLLGPTSGLIFSFVRETMFHYLNGFGYAFSNKDRLYDHDRARLVRVRNVMVAYIKDKHMPLNAIGENLSKIEQLDKIIDATPEHSPLNSYFNAIARLVSGDYRRERAYELYQNQLESLVHNDLFIQSKKLQNIQLVRK